MPDLADEGDITALAFPHLQFSIWVSPRCGIEPTPSLQRKLVACSVFNHWATSPLKTFFRFKHASSSDTFNNRVDVRQINKLVPYWISLPSSLCKIPINSSGWDDSAYLEQSQFTFLAEKYDYKSRRRPWACHTPLESPFLLDYCPKISQKVFGSFLRKRPFSKPTQFWRLL